MARSLHKEEKAGQKWKGWCSKLHRAGQLMCQAPATSNPGHSYHNFCSNPSLCRQQHWDADGRAQPM